MSDSKLIADLTVWENHVRRYDFEGQDNALGSVLQRAREALSAQVDTQVGTRCDYTKAITVYDLGPANNPESILRAKLIEMGWTPPTIKDIN